MLFSNKNVQTVQISQMHYALSTCHFYCIFEFIFPLSVSRYPGRQRIRGICVIGVMLQQTSSNLDLFMVNLFPRNHCYRIHLHVIDDNYKVFVILQCWLHSAKVK